VPTQQQIEMVLWAIRSLRLEKAEIPAESVQKFAALNNIDLTLEAVQEAMEELEQRGFQIRAYQEDVPSNCILVEPA
jgi:hypothetical protein